jgi:putative Holliday junction resolvase
VSGNDGGSEGVRGGAPMARRVLGIDLGERRIGVALGEVQTHSALPLATLSRARSIDEDARVVARLAAEQRADELVVGLPLNADGSEGPQAARTREWGVAVAAATGLPLRFRDERLTTVRAEQRIGGPARGRSGGPPSAKQLDAHRARIDREAAVLILQDELDATAGPADESASGPAGPRSEEPNESA